MVIESLARTETTSKNQSLLTGEDLYALGDIGRTELVKGVLVNMAPTGHPHGFVEFNIGGILRNFVRQHGLGRVMGGEVGIYTSRNPDTVRGADVVFISHARMAQVESHSFLDVAPELVVEILSPDDTWRQVNDKLEEHFHLGVKLIWVVDPIRQLVYVYETIEQASRLTTAETLTGGEVLPGFAVMVAELFV